MTNETKAAKPQAAIQAPSDWMIVDSLLYRLNEFGVNCDEINVTMADGSRKESPRAKRAKQLLAALAPAIQAHPLTDADIERIVCEAVKQSAISWVGYSKDEHGFYTVPVLSKYHYQIARAIERHLSGQTGAA